MQVVFQISSGHAHTVEMDIGGIVVQQSQDDLRAMQRRQYGHTDIKLFSSFGIVYTPILWQPLFGNVEVRLDLDLVDQCRIVCFGKCIALYHHAIDTDTYPSSLLETFDMDVT